MSLEKKSGEELMKVDSWPVEHCSDGSLGSVDEIGSESGLLWVQPFRGCAFNYQSSV